MSAIYFSEAQATTMFALRDVTLVNCRKQAWLLKRSGFT